MKKHNFSAGPAILPESVFAEASEAVRDFNGMGLSILEISHRSKQFVAVLEEAEQLVRDLTDAGEDYAVLFLTGGASSQFFYAPMNLLGPDHTAGYIDTGTWSAKAIKEAKAFGQVEVLASSAADNYTYIPTDYEIPAHLRYLHMTSNNTVFGTQHPDFPDTNVPIVCDMSSDILSRPLDLHKFGLIYAGAQKNIGPAGVTVVIVRKDWLGELKRHIPTMLDYRTHIKKNSSFNTPPVYPIYVSMLTMRWVTENGGVAAMAERNAAKAKLVYDEIDSNPRFKGTVANAYSRSTMNATFVCTDEADSDKFLAACQEADINGIKGHRSVGGFRASMYNSMELKSVEALVNVMQTF
ncbi:MAG: 3-phosphoserine/phosphohydroxythreonine transaminase [Bacteroidota bacterium]